MSLKFDPMSGDEDEYYAAREEVLTEYEAWATSRPGVEEGWGADAALLLDWRYHYSTGDLAAFNVDDVSEFLLEWCPRKVASGPEHWLDIVEGVEAWLLFLNTTGRWTGGLVQPVLKSLAKITPRFLDAMGDPSKAGLGKGLMANPAFADLDIDDPASIQAAMDAFNSLSYEERLAATDQGIANLGGPPRAVDLPLVRAADHEAAVAQAAEAPIITQVAAMREYLGNGKALTTRGNLKLVDARALLALVPTDDVPDRSIGDHEYKLRSADDLWHLTYLIDVAKEANALRQHANKLVGVKGWTKLDALAQVEALLNAMLEIGPIFGRGVHQWMVGEAELIEDGLMHWMVPVLVVGEHPVDEIVDQAIEVVTEHDPGGGGMLDAARSNPDRRRDSVELRIGEALDVVERCGLVTRSGAELQEKLYSNRTIRTGGVLHITELGRLLLPPRIEQVGYRIGTLDTLADFDAGDLLAEMADDRSLDPVEVWELWTPERTPEAKAEELVAAMAVADSPHERLVAISLLQQSGDAGAAIRSLHGTPLEGHATLFLMEQGLFDPERDGDFDRVKALSPIIDNLAVIYDEDPDEMIVQFDEMGQHHDPLDIIGNLWQIDLPETIELLEAIGRMHPEKAVAKAARKAVFQHRSRYPG